MKKINKHSFNRKMIGVIIAMLVSIAIPVHAQEITSIGSASELATFRDAVNGGESYEGQTVSLTADITVSNWDLDIGSKKPFLGTFDGCGYVIDLKGSEHLFGNLGSSGKEAGTVRNLGVKMAIMASGIDSYGGIAGWNYGTIEQCYTEGTITVENNNGYSYAGGIAGQNFGAIRDCYSTVSITVQSGAGGIAQYNKQGGTIERCYATGAISAGKDVIGGIVENNGGIAGNNDGSITNCIALNIGGISNEEHAGRIAGKNEDNATLTSNYASPIIPGTWGYIGEQDGNDLTEANFITEQDGTKDAFYGWKSISSWDFADATRLPLLKTVGLDADKVIAGQGEMAARAVFMPVKISTSTDYDAALHNNKYIDIADGGHFTVEAGYANATLQTVTVAAGGSLTMSASRNRHTIDKLVVEDGAEVFVKNAFNVNVFQSSPCPIGNRWMAYGSQFDNMMVTMAGYKITTFYAMTGYSSAAADKQKWDSTKKAEDCNTVGIGSPCLLAIEGADHEVTFSATAASATMPIVVPPDAIPATGTKLNTGSFLFCTNRTLHNLRIPEDIPVAYLLNDDGTRFERTENAIVKPFQSYMVANAVTTAAVMSLRVAGDIPTANDTPALPSDTFRVWATDGQLYLDASQPADVQIYNTAGQLVRRFALTSRQTVNLPRGIYFVHSNNITYKVSL